MKITLAADLHVGTPNRLDDILWAVRKMVAYNVKHGIKHLIILGDLLHDREAVNIKDFCELVEVLDEATTKYDQEVIVFPGNHDMYLKNSWEITSIKPLARHVRYIDSVSDITIDGKKIWIIPFIYYEDEYVKTYNEVASKASPEDYLFTHIGIKNAQFDACFLLKSWSSVDFNNNPFKKIFTGHFHNYQKIWNNIFYVGSPIPFKFDEGDVDHGFVVLDLDTGEHELVSIWAGEKGSAPPQYLTLDDELILSKTSTEVSGNMVRVALFKEYTNNQMAEMRAHLEKLGAKTVRFINWASKEDKNTIEITQQSASSAGDLFERFVDADDKGSDGLTKSWLLKLNKEIIIEGDRRYK